MPIYERMNASNESSAMKSNRDVGWLLLVICTVAVLIECALDVGRTNERSLVPTVQYWCKDPFLCDRGQNRGRYSKGRCYLMKIFVVQYAGTSLVGPCDVKNAGHDERKNLFYAVNSRREPKTFRRKEGIRSRSFPCKKSRQFGMSKSNSPVGS